MAREKTRAGAHHPAHGDEPVQVYVSVAAPPRGGFGLTPTIT